MSPLPQKLDYLWQPPARLLLVSFCLSSDLSGALSAVIAENSFPDVSIEAADTDSIAVKVPFPYSECSFLKPRNPLHDPVLTELSGNKNLRTKSTYISLYWFTLVITVHATVKFMLLQVPFSSKEHTWIQINWE